MKTFEIIEKTGTVLPFPAAEVEVMEDEFDAVDPYQEFFDFLVTEGTTPGDAWDRVWENPQRAAEVGLQLAISRQATARRYALAS